MKKRLLYFVFSLFFLLVSNLSFGQAFTATYDFSSFVVASGQSDPTGATPASIPGLTCGLFTAASTLSTSSSAGNRFSFSKWPPGATAGSDAFTGSIDTTKYYSVTLTPNAAKLTLTTMTFTVQRSSTGIRQYAVRSSLDSYNSNLAASINPTSAALSVVATNIFQITDATTGATNGSTITFDATAFANLTAPVTIRFYGINANGTAGGGTFSIDNVVFNGSTTTVSSTPTLVATPTSLDFGATTGVNGSSVKTFTLSGSNLTAGATLTTADPYSISVDGGTTFNTTATITAATLAAAQTISVKFSPTTTTATTGNIAITSTGAATQNVGLAGTGVTPTLTASATTLTFTSQAVGTTSTAQSVTLSGVGLSTNTTVSVAAPFAISKDGTNYSTLVTYTPAELAATTSPTLSVVFAPTAAGTPTGTITIASAGATSKTVSLNGTATGSGNSIANHVVISQLYTAGGNSGAIYNWDFIELYNPTSADVNLSTWSLQYQSAAGVGAFSGQTTFPAGTVIKSHGYYLVQEQPNSQTVTVGAALPVTADLATVGIVNNFNLGAGAGKLALCNSTTVLNGTPPNTAATSPPLLLSTANIVDFVGWGLVNYNESFVLANPAVPTTTSLTGSAPAMSATGGDIRLANASSTAATLAPGGSDATAGNGYDTNVNSTDFVLETGIANIVPRNSQTTATVTTTTPPALTTSVSSIDFGTTVLVNSGTLVKTFTLSASSLTAPVTLTTAAPYTISVDGGTTYVTTATITAATLATAQTISVKFTPTTTTAATGSVSITTTGAIGQGVILNGTGTNVVALPTLTATPTTLAFGNVNAGVTLVKTFTLGGSTLTTATTTVNATAPYTVSKDGTTYTASVTYSVAELTATTAPTVSVKFSPLAAGAANSTITFTNTEVATLPTVTITGTGVIPVLTATTAPATTPTAVDFGNQTISTSAVKSYALSGVNLVGSTTVHVTGTGYLISKDNTTFATTDLTYTAAELTATTAPSVYIKFTPATIGTLAGSITNTTTGTGAVVLPVALTGISVAAPVPAVTLNPAALTFSATVNTTSASQSFIITGANISGATTVTATAPYTISKTAGGTYGTSLAYTLADFPTGAGAQTVFVQFSPTLVGTATPNTNSLAIATASGNTQTLILNGTGVGVPALTVATTPTTTPTTLTFSGVINTTSTQTYSLSGVYLTANTVLTATGPYTISKDGTTFASTLTYTTTDLASAQTVTVKFSPLTVGANNGTITNASTGAATQTVTLTGTGLGVPTLTVAPAALTFAQGSGTTSAAQSFIITGANITAATILTTAAPYSISKTSTGTYGTTLTYTAADFANPQTVYVIFAPTTIGSANGTISVVSTGAASQTVTLTGTGVNSAPTLAAISDIALCYTATAQTIPLTGISAGESTQTTIVSATSDNPGLFSQFGVLPLTSSTAQINYTLASGASGVANVTVTVKDNGGTANGGIDTYTRTFKITVSSLAVVTITSDANGNVVSKGSNATLTATGGTSYSWTANSTIISSLTNASVTIRPSATTTYTVTATNAGGCTTTQSITIQVVLAKSLETSNVITPNGDGKNDIWVVRNIDLYPANTVKVYDKTGKLVYSKTGYNNDWNGYYNGSPLPQGTYIYVVDLGTGVPYKGVISVVRD
ncbi:gliding motility-associated-like protein [Mucilaginibacter gracilis]|uniref:Gliding motility-associated-like protein n=1 Tax=Mucilaginibacter gracilis TaxID=423350 RepID=A0A495J7Q8_9SPHI|nr:gliding motility-associated C-terminal domain-containing protein [Mucilaginibacter gracilis]RKR84448.1 gliding motility-associated-like protein [Mucilaginibacter gracilis]